jgi:hypothetical protein
MLAVAKEETMGDDIQAQTWAEPLAKNEYVDKITQGAGW